ncbi:MAG: glycosyltransferase family 39 protein [Candidatus Altiarchaeota archaeon]
MAKKQAKKKKPAAKGSLKPGAKAGSKPKPEPAKVHEEKIPQKTSAGKEHMPAGTKSSWKSPDKILLLILFMAVLPVFSQKIFMSYEAGMDYVLIATLSFEKIYTQSVADQPPFYFLILKEWINIFGKSEVSVRIFLLLFLEALIILTYLVSMKVFNNRYAALLAALLVSHNPTVSWFTFDPKYWMMFTTLSMISLYLLIRLIEKPTFRMQLLFGISAGILPGTCLVGFGVILAYAVFLFFLLIFRKVSLAKLIVPFCIILLLSSPIIYRLEKAKDYLVTVQKATRDGNKPAEPEEFFKGSVKGVFMFFVGDFTIWHQIFLYGLIITAAALAILANIKNKYPFLFLLWVAILLAGGYYASRETSFRHRYFVPITPIIYILSANIISKIRPKWALTAVTVFVVASSAMLFYDFFTDLHFQDFKNAGIIANQIYQPGDEIIVVKQVFKNAFEEVYLGKDAKGYNKLENFKIPSNGDIILIHEGEYTNKLNALKTEFYLNRSWGLHGVGVHYLSRKEDMRDSFLKSLKEAGIKLIVDGETIDCKDPQFDNICFREDWQQIKSAKLEIDRFERECIFVHPRNGKKVELDFSDRVFDNTLVLYAGIEDDYILPSRKLSQCYIDVYSGDEKIDTVIVPNKDGYMRYAIDTSKYLGRKGIKLRFYTDYDFKRHLCFNAVTTGIKEEAPNDYFYENIKKAKVYLLEGSEKTDCNIWKTDGTYPHNEQEAPFVEGKMFERWDCEEDLLKKGALWKTYARGFDSSSGDFREALWLHPHAGKIKRVEYDNVPLSGTLYGFYGINDNAFDKMPDNAITFTIYVDGKKVYSDTFKKRLGWKDFNVSDSSLAGRKDVIFEITAETDRWTHFYYNAYI